MEGTKKREANRLKAERLSNDSTAKQLLNYFDKAAQDSEHAMFYLYKVIEKLELEAGGEKHAKANYGCNEEWNLIGKVANASYGDVRHAPKPADTIKPWSEAEIADCFLAAKKIIFSYTDTLFEPQKAQNTKQSKS